MLGDLRRFRAALGPSLLVLLGGCTKAPVLGDAFDSNGTASGTTGPGDGSVGETTSGGGTTGGTDNGGTAVSSTLDDTGVSSADSTTDNPASTTSAADNGASTDAQTSGSTAGESSSTGPIDTCGDGIVDAGEACDTDDLDGQDCDSQGFLAGDLACAADCTFDTSDCSMPVCQMDATPAGGVCPPECTGGCDMVTLTCNIDCTSNACDGDTIDCPAAWACFVDCDGTTACDDVVVNCPDHACTISCLGTVACTDATFNCGTGTCTVLCDGTSPCEGSTMNCGTRDSTLTCDVTAVNPVPVAAPDPGSSCVCETVDCV